MNKEHQIIAAAEDRHYRKAFERLVAGAIIVGCLLYMASRGFGQTNLPEVGTLDALKGKTKVYLIADGESKKSITKKLDKLLTIVGVPADAEFFLEYTIIDRDRVAGMIMETGQIDAFYYRDKIKVIAWTGSKVGGGFKGDTPWALADRFARAYKKL